MVLILLRLFPGLLWPALAFSIARSLTTLILGKWLGSLLDRYPTRRVLGIAIALQTVSLLSFAFSTQLPQLSPWYFLPSSIGLGIGGFLYEVGLTYTLLPALAGGARLTRLTTIFHSMHQFAEVGGPLLAGVLLAWGGAVPVLVMDGLTFVAELVGLLLLKLPAQPRAAVALRDAPGTDPALPPLGLKDTQPPPAPMAPSAVDSPELSWGALWSTLGAYHAALPYVVLAVGLAWCNGMSPYNTTFLFFMKEQLALSEGHLSWIRAVGAFSSVVGAVLFPLLTAQRSRLGHVLTGGAMLEAACLVVAALFRNHLPMLMSCVMLSRLGLNLFILSSIRLRQELIPLDVRGAVNGRINAFYRGMALLSLLAQTVLDRTPTSYAWLAWSTALAIGLAAISCLPVTRLLRIMPLSAPTHAPT